jgi:hypothetical protein
MPGPRPGAVLGRQRRYASVRCLVWLEIKQRARSRPWPFSENWHLFFCRIWLKRSLRLPLPASPASTSDVETVHPRVEPHTGTRPACRGWRGTAVLRKVCSSQSTPPDRPVHFLEYSVEHRSGEQDSRGVANGVSRTRAEPGPNRRRTGLSAGRTRAKPGPRAGSGTGKRDDPTRTKPTRPETTASSAGRPRCRVRPPGSWSSPAGSGACRSPSCPGPGPVRPSPCRP